ncbi:hypothetical protein [Cellulomonas sp. PhB143]|uniref:hypothetical protein n=1 Tax=Cellulomonas sp. PhB143 TaxID=2485186 RepID=UPI000F46C04C|nr:hypothetical protein [Cellulomonas sp. PhB143]ROS74348.1 hypothetical protein EDF32_2089 [Cellulomonas sp. PhB143]
MTVVDMPVVQRTPEAGGRAPDRAALARAALHAVERRTGVRAVPGPALPRPAVPPEPALPLMLRQDAGTRRAVEIRPSEAAPVSERFWPVHPELVPLLPQGALQRGTTVVVQGSTTLLLSLVAQASTAGAWTTLLGHERVGMVAASDAGVVLERTALVPAPGPDAAAAAAALIDGMDVVVLGPQAALADADRRRLSARARERGSLLVSVAPWPGAHVVLTAGAGRWTGLDHGAGWLRSRTLPVERVGRGEAARPARFEVRLPLGPLAPGRAPGSLPEGGAHEGGAQDGRAPGLRLVG